MTHVEKRMEKENGRRGGWVWWLFTFLTCGLCFSAHEFEQSAFNKWKILSHSLFSRNMKVHGIRADFVESSTSVNSIVTFWCELYTDAWFKIRTRDIFINEWLLIQQPNKNWFGIWFHFASECETVAQQLSDGFCFPSTKDCWSM